MRIPLLQYIAWAAWACLWGNAEGFSGDGYARCALASAGPRKNNECFIHQRSVRPAVFRLKADPLDDENDPEESLKGSLGFDAPNKREENVGKTEEEATREVFGRLLFFDRFRNLGYFVGIGIIVIGYVLRYFGYDYVVDERGLRIDTVEARQFQDEIVRNRRYR